MRHLTHGKAGTYMATWFERYAESVAEGAVGSVPVGIARNYLRRQINPASISLPVDKRAWLLDAGAGLLGLVLKGFAYSSRRGKDETLDNIGEGFLLPAIAYTTEDVTHELMRKNQLSAPQKAPTTTAAVSAPVVRPVPVSRVSLSEDF